MVLKMVGRGAQYQIGYRDSDGEFLTGENNYSLHFPPNVPAKNYWSVVLYDADTRGLANNGTPFPTVSSNQKVTYNKDGSADILFGPKPPKDKAANWIKTMPGRGWFAGVRFYSPTQAYFDQTWKPDDIVKIDSVI